VSKGTVKSRFESLSCSSVEFSKRKPPRSSALLKVYTFGGSVDWTYCVSRVSGSSRSVREITVRQSAMKCSSNL
jgi:hypothetical protein